MAVDLVNVVATLAAGIGLVAAVAQLFRASGKRYAAELGAVKVEFESAEKVSRKAEEATQRDLDRLLDELSVGQAESSARDKELTEQIAEVVRTEVSKLRHVSESRAEQILSNQYHRQGLAQSNIAFQLSLVFAGLGFLIIAASVVVVLVSGDVSSGIVAVVSGAIVEAVSGLFFIQANQARRLMIQFFDRLRVDRSLEEALKLSALVPDPVIKSRLSTLLSVRLAKAEATDDVLRTIMDSATENQGETGS